MSLRVISVLMFLWAPLLGAAEQYELAAGDEIEIQVYQEPDLSMKVRLDKSGIITYPYLGDLNGLGKSVSQLKEEIDKGLRGDILINPSVNITVTKYRNFYLAGEVKSTGGYPYEPGLTVRQALALAGGLTEWGSESKIEILRENAKSATPANYESLVQAGDTITVKEGLF